MAGRAPNLGILFAEPVATPALRHEREGGPLRGERLAGIRLYVKDPQAARQAFSRWGVVRAITAADAAATEAALGSPTARVDGPPGSRRSLERARLDRKGWAGIPVLALLPAMGVWVGQGIELLVLAAVIGSIAVRSWRRGSRRQAAVLIVVTVAASLAAFLLRPTGTVP